MRLEKEVRFSYRQARRTAVKEIRKAEKVGMESCPKDLKNVIGDIKIAKTVDLGILEIPVDQIVGASVFEDKRLYSPDFLPAAAENSLYADQWNRIYLDYLSDEGWDSPISCFEFLGRFYVQDGKKRVSVLKAHGAAVTKAAVTRIMPVLTQDAEIVAYYEFLNDYKKTGLYQVAFTQPGSFANLQKLMGHSQDYVWNDNDRFRFLFHLPAVACALENAFEGRLHITPADAMVALMEAYSMNELGRMQPWDLTKLLQDSWVKLFKIADPDFEAAPIGAA